MNNDLPGTIPTACGYCEHFVSKGITDGENGICSFYKKPTNSSAKCDAFSIIEEDVKKTNFNQLFMEVVYL